MFAVYTNSMLATLNARKILARGFEADAISISLQDLPNKCQPRSISVKIDTTKQQFHNGGQTPDESSDSEAVS
jgi:hypothetical protein